LGHDAAERQDRGKRWEEGSAHGGLD